MAHGSRMPLMLGGLFCFLLAISNSAQAKVVSVAGSNFSFELPDDWQEIPQVELDAFVAGTASPGSTFRYSGGFEPASHTKHFQLPYLLISFKYYENDQHHTTISEADLRALTALSAGVPDAALKKSLRPDIASQLTVSGKSVSYFTTPPGFLLDMDVESPAGLTHLHRLGYIGQVRAIGLDFAAPKADYSSLEPIIQHAAATFTLPPSEQVTLIQPPSASPGILVSIAVILGFIGVAVVMILNVRRLFRRRS